ncbi:metal ABC transporter substrate-binding protein [Flaviflagellibacter deserti]|uniref:Metal ABC transporter substrate-binding protein n=1 Tax=Flaviflagellibacter deserti TaxID=2267266 RepID=A0ABV9YZX4_9HYPH
MRIVCNVITLLAIGAGLALSAPAHAQDKLATVASFSILGDFVKNVGGDRIAVTTLVGPNGDAHVYEPTPADAKALNTAKVVFINGLGFEGWMDRLVRASGSKATVVTASQGVTPIAFAGEEEDDHAKGKKHAHEEHEHGQDPHAFQSIANVKLYVGNIRDALIAADPAGKDVYEANATAYTAKLDALDGEVKAAIQAIPEGQRKIITSHDAFGYFGKAYGFAFIAPQDISTESEASAKDVARLIRQIKADKVKAVFVENITDRRLIDRIAKETGAVVGGELYSDALSPPDGPAATYIDMFHHNIKTLSAALSS